MSNEPIFETMIPRRNARGAEVRSLLAASGLEIEKDIQIFVVACDAGRIVACAGLAGEVVKCVTIAEPYRGSALACRLMCEVQMLAMRRGHSHLFLYTKPGNAVLFEGCGFHMLAEVKGHACLMENTPVGIRDYCDKLQPFRQTAQRIGSVVINANPFTLGHLHLVREARRACDWLHVFVVSENASAIAYAERLDMVRAGLAGMDRVTVHRGSRYLISKATFPGYFIKDSCVVEACSTAMDLLIFRKYIAPALGITHRFVGSEPFCRLTAKYNEDMLDWLETAAEEGAPIQVVEFPRFEVEGRAVSASEVRRLLARGDFAAMDSLVPVTTLSQLRASYARVRPAVDCRATELIEVM
jgi:[citrate (pro-3S)-lyase] ligase